MRFVVVLVWIVVIYGVWIFIWCWVVELHGDGVVICDEVSGIVLMVKVCVVINVTGVWVGGLVLGVYLCLSRGMYLVFCFEVFGCLCVGLMVLVFGAVNWFVFVFF